MSSKLFGAKNLPSQRRRRLYFEHQQETASESSQLVDYIDGRQAECQPFPANMPRINAIRSGEHANTTDT